MRIDISHHRFFVVTGGPGSGKTTLLRALAARGYACREESGRAIIRAQVAAGGTALPWADAAAFADRMLAADIDAYQAALTTDGPVLFDRGIPDVIGYRRLVGLPIPDDCRQAAARDCRYDRRVLFAPPWPAIFVQDGERRQTFEEAEATFRVMMSVYTELGYEPLLLPRDTVAARAAFAMTVLGPPS